MQYIGGKQKSGGVQIAQSINAAIVRHGLTTYSEPFCGGLSVTTRVQAPTRYASDACIALITLYQSMQGGWCPPTSLDKEAWDALKVTQDPQDPLTAFAGFGCSFGGSWFGSYAQRYKYTKRWVTAAEAASSSLTKKMGKCDDVHFQACDYHDAPFAHLVYCDPPYRGTMGYGAVGEWNPDEFWAWATLRAQQALVAVSEMTAPEKWTPIRSFKLQHRIATGSGERREEHLFVPTWQVSAWTA